MITNKDTREVQGNGFEESTRGYKMPDGTFVNCFKRYYANGEHTLFQIGNKVVSIIKTTDLKNEKKMAEWCYKKYKK